MSEAKTDEALTVTATVSVWLSEYHKPNELLEAIERGNTVRAINMLTLYGPCEQKSFGEYARVGEADVTVRLIPKDEQTRLAVEVLNKQLAKLREAFHMRQQEILAEISKLQAITYDAEVA